MSLANYWSGSKDGLILVVAVILAGLLGLGLGRWSKLAVSPEPLEITNVPNTSTPTSAVPNSVPTPVSSVGSPVSAKNFVASKNGTKYYLPSCAGAKRIKEENKVWFASAEEAKARGLTPASGCPGL